MALVFGRKAWSGNLIKCFWCTANEKILATGPRYQMLVQGCLQTVFAILVWLFWLFNHESRNFCLFSEETVSWRARTAVVITIVTIATRAPTAIITIQLCKITYGLLNTIGTTKILAALVIVPWRYIYWINVWSFAYVASWWNGVDDWWHPWQIGCWQI